MSIDGGRPFWTFDDKGVDIEKLRVEFHDSVKEPKHSFVVSSSYVKKEELVPNCYEMARMRSSSEFAKQTSELIKTSGALSDSADSSEFAHQIESQTKTFLVGAEIVGRTWLKTEDEDGEKKVKCWIVLSVPRSNLKKLQQQVLETLEKETSGEPALKDRVKTAMDKMTNAS